MINAEIKFREIPDSFPDNLGEPLEKATSSHSNNQKLIEVVVNLNGLTGRIHYLSFWWRQTKQKPKAIRRLFIFCVLIVAVTFNFRYGIVIADYLSPLLDFLIKPGLIEAIGSGCLSRSPEGECTYRLSFVMLVLAVVLMLIIYAQFFRRPLLSISLYILNGSDPFPVIHPHRHRGHKHLLAVRILEPNIATRIKNYPRQSTLTRWTPLDLSQLPPSEDNNPINLFSTPFINQDAINLSQDIWPIVRVAIDRLLYKPRWKDFEKGNFRPDPKNDPSSRTPKNQIYFAYKMHAPQIALFLILIILAICFTALIAKPINTQYPMALGGASIVWAIFSCWLHRRQRAALVQWSDQWQEKPFTHCPVFYYGPENPPEMRWEELSHNDFRARIEEYGVDNNKLFEWACTLLTIGFLTFLGIIK
ncbi:hypothetical protein ACO0LM_22260 [Undibacterium sp. Di26W]|uniref:hypothetical protein n=1 Tax=Undibacterium sp. Di26W TaxID=3413035 RepID=UPI003BF247FA